jgi:hypothetical protein
VTRRAGGTSWAPIARRRSKYHAVPVMVGAIRFASKREGRRYQDLQLLQRAGEIVGLELQPSFEIRVNGRHICIYRADFRYIVAATGKTVIEDAKGMKTPVYRLKKKLVEAQYDIQIQET